MPSDEVSIAIRLRNAAKFVRDSAESAKGIRKIGEESRIAGAAGRLLGDAYSGAGRALGAVASQAKYGAFALGALGAAGVKMGLSFNAQVESARLRFGLFTSDVEGLTKAVQKIDMNSAFNFGDLSDAAALFGNAGIKNIPDTLQAAANAAAASGRGVEGFKSIAIALSQIASKGRLSQEEINQLNEAGAPGAQRVIAEHFQLTAKQLQNLGGQGLDATEAIQALTSEWTSGKMAKAAQAQTKTLGGQWLLLGGNVQKLMGAATESLADGLRDTALPAVNKATQQITEIFGREGLSNEQKIAQARKVIVRELGPVWHDISEMIDEADIPDKLGDAVAAATPRVLDAMAAIAPKAAKAFVDGWLGAGPEAQAITALFLGNKIRKSIPGKGGASKAASALGSRGATPANPVFVAIVKKPDSVKDIVKKVLPAGGAIANTVAGAGGAAGLGAGAAAAVPLAGVLGLALTHNQNNPARGPGASSPSNPAGSIAPPGFGNTGGIQQTNLILDGQRVAQVWAPYTQIETARANAAAAARK